MKINNIPGTLFLEVLKDIRQGFTVHFAVPTFTSIDGGYLDHKAYYIILNFLIDLSKLNWKLIKKTVHHDTINWSVHNCHAICDLDHADDGLHRPKKYFIMDKGV
jgi:hypothetical protein